MNKKLIVLLKVLACVPFVALWYFIFCGISVAYYEGAWSVYKDAFGVFAEYAVILCLIASLTSIIYLRFFIKKEVVVQVVAYILTIVFVVGAIYVAIIGESKFSDFSTQDWIEYPERRTTMYFDLAEKYGEKGLSESEVAELLGQPDEIAGTNTYVYDCHFGNAVYVEFLDGVVKDIYCIE